MIQYLSGIVKDTSIGGSGDNFFHALAFEFSTRHKCVKVVYISLQVFTIMVIYSGLADYRFEPVVCIREFGHFVSHN